MMGLIILGLIVAVVGYVIMTYNGLVKLRVTSEEAESDIDTQLKRRYDLIPNIVETVKGYAKHEASTLENVMKARSQAANATNMAEKSKAETGLSGALRQLFAVAENYPDLKANQNFLDLQQTLREVEDQIQRARRYYNAVVRDLNTKIQQFPSNLIANAFSFREREFFEIEESQRENVQVKF